MISAQVLMNCIEELRMITRVNLAVFDLDGAEIVSTFESSDISPDMLKGFAQSPADSQVIGMDHLLKITDEGELVYVLVARGSNDETYLIARIAASQIQQLITAYKERFDRNNFFQNLLLDNFLLVDVYNRAKKLHLEVTLPRVVYIVETQSGKDSTAAELLKGMFSAQSGDFVTAVDESRVILIKALERGDGEEQIEQTAQTIVDMMSTEAMLNVRVAYGSAVQ
ncbi:MAG: PucR family transcriptional regulator, partial [Lachnospiraceae bacterium]|nr:PucR family transcriptional regulator [Lachnospiraceae bacterium]